MASPTAAKAKTQCDAIVGKQCPDIKLQVFSKNDEVSCTTLFELMSNGLPTVIDFFTTWCTACPAAAKKLEALAASDYAGQANFIIVSLEGEDGVMEFVSAHGIENCVVAAIEDLDDLPAELGIK